MNARNLTALFVSITLFAPSLGQAGQAVGTAKARGDYRPFSQSQQSVARSVRRSRPAYRYSAPQSALVIVRSAPAIRAEEGAVIAQAPVEARRFSQAPAAENANPCPESAPVASQPSTGRRYSTAPAPTTSSARRYSYAPSTGSAMRSYSGNVGRSSQPLWSLPKTDSRKFNAR